MFDRRTFGQMRRGLGLGVSKGKLSQAMLEILVQLPMGTKNLKNTVVANLGLFGQMAATRDVNDAWRQAKRKAAKEHPARFLLDGRAALLWNDGSVKVLDKKITSAHFKKLNELAEAAGCSVDQLVGRLIRMHQRRASAASKPNSA